MDEVARKQLRDFLAGFAGLAHTSGKLAKLE
ncbi:hypothetical protein C8R34_1133 [Nitrosomonas sp. Nm84]|nr:hypothetical protein C8R34_1133 [Nitrosomonas sp. Nm84]